ncbi:PAS domain S-box protein [Haloarculaceae archaeon H-GB2-1]|nr:PAS domain S-box protein [Haloarculaceae archaeon H-GB11]MEA5408259.1 PAS domain S-box protein [Haloarculaceae archaeon H-GB2-1]
MYSDRAVWRVVGWCLLGLLPVVVVSFLTVLYQRSFGVSLARTWFVVVQLSGIGALGGLLTGVYDVRRVTAHERRRAVSGEMEALVSASPLALISVSTEGIVQNWNPAAERMFGYDAEEVVGERYPLVPDSFDDEFDDHLERVNSGETIRGVETKRQHRNGSLLDVSIWTAPIREEDEVTGTIVALADISDRKRRERELRTFQQAVEQARNSILITDTDGNIQYVNPAFEEQTGYTREEAVGDTPAIVNSGKQPPSFYEDLWKTILDGDDWHARIVNERKSGELYEVNQTITPIFDEDGTVEHFVAIEVDVTDEVRRRQQLQVLQRVLRHNLRNDMTVVLGHVERLRQEEATSSAWLDSVDKIEATAEELLALGEKVRTTRQALADDTQHRHSIDVAELVPTLAETASERYPQATISSTVDATDCPVDGSIETALEELLDNAVRHSDRAAPTVDLSARCIEDGDWIEIRVADDGPGIPDEEREVLRRGAETALLHGTGLGLWLVNWTVTAAGGEVSIDVSETYGTVVTVRTPIRD